MPNSHVSFPYHANQENKKFLIRMFRRGASRTSGLRTKIGRVVLMRVNPGLQLQTQNQSLAEDPRDLPPGVGRLKIPVGWIPITGPCRHLGQSPTVPENGGTTSNCVTPLPSSLPRARDVPQVAGLSAVMGNNIFFWEK